jgi:2-polyprenyl-3-methyl-5-hydroxy-6-metoxy-1,4-benzoquinol methylase
MGVAMPDARQETQLLNSIARDSWYAHGCNAASIHYRARVFARFFGGGSCLELGPAEGLMTGHLMKHFADLTCVEGAPDFCDILQKRYPRLQVVNALFENFEPSRRFDNIILGHVLEHVSNPVALLERVRIWLSANGKVFASVPNARSVHRQMGVLMGLLETEDMDTVVSMIQCPCGMTFFMRVSK